MKSILKTIIIFILTLESKLVLKKYKPKIIAVTGSVGKTSTKDAIYTALLPFFHVRKTNKSYNSHIGIPLTILGCPNGWNSMMAWLKNILRGLTLILRKKEYPEWLILEIGADRPRDIEKIVAWIKPDISVVTRIGKTPVHIEFYDSLAEVIKEKSFIVRALKKEGVLILNSDDEDVLDFKKYSTAKLITFGAAALAPMPQGLSVKASFITITYEDGKPSGMSFKVDIEGSSIPVFLKGAIGLQHAYPVLAAFSVASALNKNLLAVADAFKSHETPPGRMKIIPGIKGATILDDTYNASPVALEEGINIMREIETSGRKIAVVGDMLELGRHSRSEHERLGAIAGVVFDIIFAVGMRAKDLGKKAEEIRPKQKNVFFLKDTAEVSAALLPLIKENDVVFIKGSQGMRMERIVEKIIAEPERKGDLLVRQEEEWLNR